MRKWIITTALSLGAILCACPIIATIEMSFWNQGISLDGWKDLLLDCFPFYPMFWNSICYSTVITLLQLIVVLPCAFAFIMLKGRFKNILFGIYLVLMMLPPQVTILPNYIGLRDLGLLNTREGIILPMVFSVLGVIIMRQYMEQMDEAQIEAARLETSSMLRILWSIVVPNMKISIFALTLFAFEESYNMLEQPMLFLKEERLQTLTVFIANAREYSGNILFPASVLFMIPVLLLYLFFHDSLEKGITTGQIRSL